MTFRDPMIFQSRVLRTQHVVRASTIVHEMAHMWFGDLVTPVWWDDLWLNESFAEYMGARVTADATEFTEVWVTEAHTRRPWGLAADQRPSTHPVAGNGAADGATALQNFDGISYAKGATIIKQLNARLGDEVFFRGVSDHFEKHRFGNATMADLLDSWERAGAGDLTSFSDGWLLTAGPDRIELDRAGRRRCCGPRWRDTPPTATTRWAWPPRPPAPPVPGRSSRCASTPTPSRSPSPPARSCPTRTPRPGP